MYIESDQTRPLIVRTTKGKVKGEKKGNSKRGNL